MKRKQVILEVQMPKGVGVRVKKKRITKASRRKKARKGKRRRKRRRGGEDWFNTGRP
jgi:hypothetical protein